MSRSFVLAVAAAAFTMLPIADRVSALPLGGQAVTAAADAHYLVEVRSKSKARGKAKAPRRATRRVGSSGPVNLTPVRPNAPIGPDLSVPRSLPRVPPVMAAPQPQSPYVGPSGSVHPVPPRVQSETFQDRAVRCQHGASLYGVPDASRGSYVHNCIR
jgi:hypothetical protein